MLQPHIVRYISKARPLRHAASRRYITSHNVISSGAKPSKPPRRPARGGQNLSERFKRLENSLRGKEAFSKELEELESQATTSSGPRTSSASSQVSTFHGFQIPEEPKPPADDECCMSGCAVCVYDLFEESMEAYKDAVKTICKTFISLKIPEDEWPPKIRKEVSKTRASSTTSKNTALSVFEQMERALEEKKKKAIEEEARKSQLIAQQRKRNKLVDLEAENSTEGFMSELYEGARWLIFSRR